MVAPKNYDAVLVPLDGSRIAAQALPPAASFAREAGCALVLLHVLPLSEPGSKPVNHGANGRERQVRRAQMQAYLEGLRHSLAGSGVDVTVRVEEGEAAGTILKVADGLGKVMMVLTDSGMSAARGCNDPYMEGHVHAQVVAEWKGPLLRVDR